MITHPGANVAEQGLTLLSGRDVMLSLWYNDSQLKNRSSENGDHFDATDLRIQSVGSVQDKAHWHYEEIVQKRNGKRILLKTFMKLSVRETETIIKILIPSYCPITKASNNSHFHSSHFFALYFPSQYQ